MIPLYGLSTLSALHLADSTRDRQLAGIEKNSLHGRSIEAFRERIGKVVTVDDLMQDQELYTFVMKAFDLEDQIFGKAMIRKILESDITDKESLVNRLTDPRFKELYKALDFRNEGKVNFTTYRADWRESMVKRYVERQFINDQAEQNEALGAVLEFRRKAPDLKTWFDVLKDKDLATFMRKALGLPDEMIKLDIDRQAALFKSKIDIAKFKDPVEVEKLVTKFVAITDALDTSRIAGNAAVQMLQNTAYAAAGGDFVPATIDISVISPSARSLYR